MSADRYGFAFKHARQDFDDIGFPALRGVSGRAWFPAVEIVLQVGLRQSQSRRTAVNYATDGGAVTFAERGDGKQFSYRISRHINLEPL